MDKKQKARNGQVWTVDFLVGFLIFVIVILVSIKIITGMLPSNSFDKLYQETSSLANTLIQQGFPSDWNETTAIIPGLGKNNRLNLTKLQRFDQIDYQRTKNLLHHNEEYIFFFRNSTKIINLAGKCVRGYNISLNAECQPDLDSIEYDNLVKFERILVYELSTNNSALISMIIYSWN